MAEFVDGIERLTPLEPAVTIFGSARTKPGEKYYTQAEELGRMLAEEGFSVITGGGPGIMEAANKGAFEAGGQTVGQRYSKRRNSQKRREPEASRPILRRNAVPGPRR